MIPRDKQLHLAAGALVGIVTAAACIKLGIGPELLIAAIGGAAGAVVGYAKELYDRRNPLTNTYDMADARFTLAGGAAGGLVGALLLPMLLPGLM